MRTSRMEVSVTNFKHNIEEVQKYVPEKEIMPVVKANGYGTYLNTRLDLMNMFNILAVAILDEAGYLRSIGYQKDIFILNQPAVEDLDEIFDIKPIIGLSSFEFLNTLKDIKNPLRVHLEIETGMNRTGIRKEDLLDFINEIKKNPNIKVEGAYTHLSSADYDEEYTLKQINTFKDCVSIIKEHFNLKYVHCDASNGLLNYHDDFTNLVRPGLILYGYEPFVGANKIIDLKPTCKLSTEITFLKTVNAGESISYSRKYITDRETKVATIPIGYADGLKRELSNKGYVVINNHRVPIIGAVCMDSCMIDVTSLENVKVGDKVYIFDNDFITLDDIAEECNTINYEILCNFSYRIPRYFIDE